MLKGIRVKSPRIFRPFTPQAATVFFGGGCFYVEFKAWQKIICFGVP